MIQAFKAVSRLFLRVVTLGRCGQEEEPSTTATPLGFGEKGVECPECGTVAIEPTEPAETQKRIEYHTTLIRRRIQQRLDEHGTLAEMWIEKGVQCPNPECQAFIGLGREGASCFPVPRHGFEEHGVTCPNCGELATEPGDWRRVQTAERIERKENGAEKDRWTEEGVCCWNCNSYLMASPDSDVDPLELGQEYDRDTYHKFVRPEGWKPPTQRTEDRPIEVDDWVVVNRGVVIEVDGKRQEVGGMEGRVKSITDGVAEIMTSTITDMGKSKFVKLSQEHCRPMVFDSLIQGTAIKVIQGKYRGRKGSVLETNQGQITIRLDNTITTLPIERIVRDL